MKVKLIAHTASPELLVGASGRLCYSDTDATEIMDSMTQEDAQGMCRRLAVIGHDSPLEHAVFTFAIDGVSRSLLAQITRHRIASYSVQSQRYVKMTDFEFVTPPEIEADEATKAVFQGAMLTAITAYRQIAEHLEERYYTEYTAYDKYPPKVARSKAQKRAIEDARFVLPNAACTKMIVTMNARELLHFFELRTCNRAQWEIRELAELMLAACYREAPTLFETAGCGCCNTGCREGRMGCGNGLMRRHEIEEIKRRNTK